MRNCTLTGNQLFQDILSYSLPLIGCSESSSDDDISVATGEEVSCQCVHTSAVFETSHSFCCLVTHRQSNSVQCVGAHGQREKRTVGHSGAVNDVTTVAQLKLEFKPPCASPQCNA